MCTAVSISGERHLFGRTLDIESSYGESVIAVPRNHRLDFLREPPQKSHLALIGIGCVRGGVPLYFDAMNEAGLSAAGLNFSLSAKYHPATDNVHNIASFEVIPWILSQCKNLQEAKELLQNTSITNDSFSVDLPSTPLHWIIADKTGSITVESVSSGLKIYENRFGILTNEPPFEYHEFHLADFLRLTPTTPQNDLCREIELTPYSRGMGAIGLPGDFSSASRFVRAFFVKSHIETAPKSDEINRFFHVMNSVNVPYGCQKNESGQNMYTLYTSCADAETLTYHFATYDDRQIRSVKLTDELMNGTALSQLQIE
ncbi:MAG: choloylglycine hydrolase [Clostridia bacterium]|nr:choloylglycine hydrolase [Clostridia bacterium]